MDLSNYLRRLEAAPKWPESQNQPPFSPRAAIVAARAQLSKLVDDARSWHFESIELHPMVVPDAWIYVVVFVANPPAQFGGPGITVYVGPSPGLRIPVLMNGRVIEPVRR